jgi:hypothetical protein
VRSYLKRKKKTFTKSAGGVAQGIGSEIKPQYPKNIKRAGLLRGRWVMRVLYS